MKKYILVCLLLAGCASNVSVPTTSEKINEKTPVANVIGYHREASSMWPGRYESSTFYLTVKLETGLVKDIVVSQGFYESITKSNRVYINTDLTCILGIKE